MSAEDNKSETPINPQVRDAAAAVGITLGFAAALIGAPAWLVLSGGVACTLLTFKILEA